MNRALSPALPVLLSLWLGAAPLHAEERVTDEVLRAQFGRAHGVMKDQRPRIHELMDGFLTGDMGLIQRASAEISRNMSKVGKEFPPAEGDEAELWKTMAAVADSAGRLEAEAQKGDYQAAYQQFAAMTGKCIACHQVRRDWGLFMEPTKQKQEATQKQQ